MNWLEHVNWLAVCQVVFALGMTLQAFANWRLGTRLRALEEHLELGEDEETTEDDRP